MTAAAAQVSKAKSKPNLSTVTPMGRPPAPAEFDTTTPVDMSVLPFTAMFLPKWTPWLLARMEEFWPHLTTFNLGSYLAPYMNGNGSIMLRAKKAIILAVQSREAFDPRPTVDIVLCFKFDPDDQEQDKDVRLLFRRVDDWAKGMGAKEIQVKHPERIDLTPSRLKEVLWGEEVKIWAKDLDK
jgi:hypothetical protein